MPVTCIMVDCGSRADRDHMLSFFRIPTVKNSVHYPHINDLSRKRREMWLAAIKREDLTDSIIRNQRICSRHFITGKPSALSDENHPDWVPSQHLGHQSTVHSKRKADVERNLRAGKRTKFSHEALEPSEQFFEESHLANVKQVEEGSASQTCIRKIENFHNYIFND